MWRWNQRKKKVNISWKSDRIQPTLLILAAGDAGSTLWQHSKCICFSKLVCSCTRFIYLHVYILMTSQKNVCVWRFVCACMYKQIKLWASEIFQKSNAGLMPLPCDQSIQGFFHYLWRRNVFGYLPTSPALILTPPEGRGECWLSDTQCIWEPF